MSERKPTQNIYSVWINLYEILEEKRESKVDSLQVEELSWRRGLGEIIYMFYVFGGFSSGSDSKEFACNAGDPGSIIGFEKIPWRRECQPTPVFLPGEFLTGECLLRCSVTKYMHLSKTISLTILCKLYIIYANHLCKLYPQYNIKSISWKWVLEFFLPIIQWNQRHPRFRSHVWLWLSASSISMPHFFFNVYISLGSRN